jgi:diacylglycerol kinase (ATP)
LRYKIIVNPAAGKGKALKQVSLLKELLAQSRVEYELVMTKGPGHATELASQAVQDGWSAITAVGGDGTINEVIQGLVGSSTPLAVIPMGTGNDLARSLSLPKTLAGSVALMLNPRILEMDLGQDQENFFACIAGIGFPADVMHNVNLSKGIFSGSVAFIWGILKTLKELAPISVTLELDGDIKQANAQGVFILNTVYSGGGLKFSPKADICDGKLDVLVMRDMSLIEVLTVLPRVYLGTHLSHPKVDFYRVKEVKVQTENPMRKMFDGNVTGQTPMSVVVCAHKLRILVS